MRTLLNAPLTRLLPLVTLIAILFSRGLTDPEIGWPDADRILMDGLFIHDFLGDLQPGKLLEPTFFRDAYQYAIGYFAQYPALSLGSRPPFFPFIEALFFFLFGIHDWSAKLALLLFVPIALWAWYDLVSRTHDRTSAFCSSAILFTSPFIVEWGWYPMLEIPVLAMTLVTANLFWRYVSSGKPTWLYLAAMAFSLALWTKQTALFMLLWIPAWLVITRQAKSILNQRSTWLALGLALLLTLPLAVITIWMGKTNLTLAFQGVTTTQQQSLWWQWDHLRQYLDILVHHQITQPVQWLALAGFILTLVRRNRADLFYLLLILSTYLFFTALHSYRIDRYTIFWVPAFAWLAALPFHHFRERTLTRNTGWVILILLVAWQSRQTWLKQPGFSRGYEQAVELAMRHSASGRIFMDGVNNGYFTYYVRLRDADRRFHILRGDKLLHASSVFAEHWTEVHVNDLDGIRATLDRHGIDILVIEERNYAQLAIHRLLRDYVEGPEFERLATIPITSSRSQLTGQELRVYRYKHPKPPARERFSISVPLVGKRFEAPVTPDQDLLPPTRKGGTQN
ncbi:MAG: glycosyltransferase family 39 protein [Magnetococcus sp. YQC-9]